MARVVERPQDVLDDAAHFLTADPVAHNLVLTLLHQRVAHPEPGRYWVVDVEGRTAGVVFQSPLHFLATITPMPPAAVHAAVDAVVAAGVRLPGVSGSAATTAQFAGHWAERTRCAARPVQGQRIYEVDRVAPPARVPGALRPPRAGDTEVLVAWHRAFQDEIGETVRDARQAVQRGVAAGRLWLWDDGGPVAMAGVSAPVAGVARVGPVYTPPDRRGHGYASALVAALSAAVRARGGRCILYADLANPTSNAIYRAIGYRAVVEALRYQFDLA